MKKRRRKRSGARVINRKKQKLTLSKQNIIAGAVDPVALAP